MKPVDLLFLFPHPCYAQLRTTTYTNYHFKNLEAKQRSKINNNDKLDASLLQCFACQNLQNKLIFKNPNIKISPSAYATESKLVYAGVWIEYIINKDTLDNLIDDMKNEKLDYHFNEYRIYNSLFS